MGFLKPKIDFVFCTTPYPLSSDSACKRGGSRCNHEPAWKSQTNIEFELDEPPRPYGTGYL